MFKIRGIVWSQVHIFLSEDMFLAIMTVMGFYEYFSCQFYIPINHLLSSPSPTAPPTQQYC